MNTLKTKRIEYGDVTVVASEASMLQATRRGQLIGEALQAKHKDPALELLAIGDYADLTATAVSVEGIEGWPLSLEEFAKLPAALIEDSGWLQAVRELNPHWYKRRDAQKKDVNQTTSTTESNAG